MGLWPDPAGSNQISGSYMQQWLQRPSLALIICQWKCVIAGDRGEFGGGLGEGRGHGGGEGVDLTSSSRRQALSPLSQATLPPFCP